MRKVALFNDTAPARHFGCEAVMAAIEKNVESRGARLIYRHPVTRPWETEPAALAAIEDADLILVNGEGTIHHGKPTAASLARLGPHSAKRGKPCFVINATIQANSQEVMHDLAACSGLWVREGRSAEEAARWGINASIGGDLSFAHVFPSHSLDQDRGLVLDAAHPEVTAAMGAIAARLRADFVAMRHNRKGMKSYRKGLLNRRFESGKPTGIVPGIDSFEKFAAFLARRRFVITGRFHGLCFALNSRVPFAAAPLDVWKSEALLADLSLHPSRLLRGAETPQPFSAREMEQISTYVGDIRGRIAAMFDRILKN